jgi:hypothetical protein
MLSRLLEAFPTLSYDTQKIANLSVAFHKASIDLNWNDWIEEGDDPNAWLPNPLNEGIINGFIRDVKASNPQSKEIHRQAIMNGKGLDKLGKCVGINQLVMRLARLAKQYSQWSTTLAIHDNKMIEERESKSSNQSQSSSLTLHENVKKENYKVNNPTHGRYESGRPNNANKANICATCGRGSHVSKKCRNASHPDANREYLPWKTSKKGLFL